MFVGTYILRMSPGGDITQNAPVGRKESMWSENISSLAFREDGPPPESQDDVDRVDGGPDESQHGGDRDKR